jgi:methyltransferase FkbM-like protein
LEIGAGDDELRSAGVASVAIIKMDIEGYEKPALEGLRVTLKNSRPIVVFELSRNPANPLSIKSEEELKSLFPDDYQFYLIDESQDWIRDNIAFWISSKK